MSKELVVGKLIRWNSESEQENEIPCIERILWIAPDYTIAFFINIFSKSGVPERRIIQDVEDAIHEKKATLIDEMDLLRDKELSGYSFFIRIGDNASDKQKKVRDRAWNIIASLVDRKNEPAIYDRQQRGQLIRNLIQTYNSDKQKGERLTEKTVYAYLRRYWQRGKTINSLLPDYINSGGKGVRKASGEAKRGRPRKNPDDPKIGKGINTSEEVARFFRIAFDTWYKNPKENSLRYVYRRMRSKFFKEVTELDETNKPVTRVLKPGEKPTYSQLIYWHNTEYDIEEVIKARKGSTAYERNHRAILGNSMMGIPGPGYKYQIDATIADVYLHSRYNVNWIIGRPVIYLVVDVFSRLIVGVYVGLEGPSWLGMMMALANTVTDKVRFCKDYEIDITEAQWPCSQLPFLLCGDNGELAGNKVETLAQNLGVEIQNVAAFRPDWKGIVERLFRTIQLDYIKPETPGFVINKAERFGKDYALDACLNLAEFTRMVIRCILRHNNRLMRTYIRDTDMISDEVPATPNALWNWGLENRSGQLNYFPEEIIKLNLLPTGIATIQPDGIHFKGKKYICEKARTEKWLEKTRNGRLKGADKKLEISYDLRTSDYIYIRDKGGRGFEVCTLMESEERYFGVSVEEAEFLRAYEAYLLQRSEDEEINEDGALSEELEDIAKEGAKRAKSGRDSSLSKSQRKECIRANREMEREAVRAEEVFNLSESKLTTPPISEPKKPQKTENPQSASPDYTKLLRERKQRAKES